MFENIRYYPGANLSLCTDLETKETELAESITGYAMQWESDYHRPGLSSFTVYDYYGAVIGYETVAQTLSQSY